MSAISKDLFDFIVNSLHMPYEGEVEGVGFAKTNWVSIGSNAPQNPYPSGINTKGSTFFNKYFRVQVTPYDRIQEITNPSPPIQRLTEDMVRHAITSTTYNKEKEVRVAFDKTIVLTADGKIDVKIDRNSWNITISLSEPKGQYSKAYRSLERENITSYTFSFQDLIDEQLGSNASYYIKRTLKIPDSSVDEESFYEMSDLSVLGLTWILVDPAAATLFDKAKLGLGKWVSLGTGIIIAAISVNDAWNQKEEGKLTKVEAVRNSVFSVGGALPVVGAPITVAGEIGQYIVDSEWHHDFRRWTARLLGVPYEGPPKKNK